MDDWHETNGLDARFRAYCERYSLEPTTNEVAGVALLNHPRVYRAEGASTTATLLEALGRPEGLTVLDMGCGTGVLGIIAALRGAGRVVLADQSPDAVANARANVALHSLEASCSVVESDLFASIPDERFDLVLFNMPFLYGDGEALQFPVSDEQRAALPGQESFMDVGYTLIGRFMAEVSGYLKAEGRCLCSFASFGNQDLLDAILRDNGLSRTTAARREEPEYGLEYLAYDVRPIVA